MGIFVLRTFMDRANTEGDHNGTSPSFTCYKYQWTGLVHAYTDAISHQQWETFHALKMKPGSLCCCCLLSFKMMEIKFWNF